MEISIAKAQLDEVMRKLIDDGFRIGYEFAKRELWILAGKDTPQTEEPVEVTVVLPDGTSQVAQSKYVNGRWTTRLGEVTAWRPAPRPYVEHVEESLS